MNYLPQTTQDMINELLVGMPPYVQDAFAEYDWQEQTARIAAKHRLGDEQRLRLLVETALVLLGIEDAALFPQAIMNHLGVSQEKAAEIATDIAGHVLEGMQAFVLEQNRDVIQAMQTELDELGRQEQIQELRDHGIDVAGYESGEQKLPEERQQEIASAPVPAHDPYHEPLFDHEPHQVELARDHEVIPPPPSPPSPKS